MNRKKRNLGVSLQIQIGAKKQANPKKTSLIRKQHLFMLLLNEDLFLVFTWLSGSDFNFRRTFLLRFRKSCQVVFISENLLTAQKKLEGILPFVCMGLIKLDKSFKKT